jgi:hypothetical protein
MRLVLFLHKSTERILFGTSKNAVACLNSNTIATIRSHGLDSLAP